MPSLIFEELPLPQRVIRDLANDNTAKIYVDSREIHAKLKEFVERVCAQYAQSPDSLPR